MYNREMKVGKRDCLITVGLSEQAPNYSQILGPRDSSEIQPVTDGSVYLTVQVKDNGPGITAAEIASLFTKFNSLGRRNAGTGLGLYLCRKLCHLQGGEITVASTAGEGTSFDFYVAVERSQAVLASTALERSDRLSGNGLRPSEAKNPMTCHVLVVEVSVTIVLLSVTRHL